MNVLGLIIWKAFSLFFRLESRGEEEYKTEL